MAIVHPETIALGFGLAGFKQGSDQTRVAAAFPGFRLVSAANDATTACIGAHAGADGGLVIAGTGSAAIARVGSKETIIGGRGFALGDDGSGSHIGLEALRSAMRAHDGLAPASALTDDISAEFGGDPVAMMNWALQAKPGDFGAFAPRVLEHAAGLDPIALKIALKAARAIGALTRGVVALGAERVALVGGVGEALRRYFEPDIAARLSPPLYDPTDGAILFVGGVVAPQHWRLNRKPRNEGFLRGADLRRRTAARRLRARCRGRFDPFAHPLRGPASRRRASGPRRRRS